MTRKPLYRNQQSGHGQDVKYLLTRDDDLLVLGNPFGVETITPARFLILLRGMGV